MEGDVVSDLVWQLAERIFPSGIKGAENGSHGQQRRQGDATVRRAHQYAMRIIGSRISPSLANDEAAMAEAIKRQLVQENRSADALSFADLHRRLASYSGRGYIENRWAILYLLRAIAEDQRRERAETRGTAIPYTSTLSGSAVSFQFCPALEVNLLRPSSSSPCNVIVKALASSKVLCFRCCGPWRPPFISVQYHAPQAPKLLTGTRCIAWQVLLFQEWHSSTSILVTISTRTITKFSQWCSHFDKR